MQRDAERCSDVGRRERIGEGDSPRLGRRLAVAAPGEQASESSDDVAERDAGGEDAELVGQNLAGAIKNDMIKEIAGDAGIARRTSRGEPPSFFYVGRILKGAGRLLW